MNAKLPERGVTVSQAEELRQLREHIREDANLYRQEVGKLHVKFEETITRLNDKLDRINEENIKVHMELAEKMAVIDKRSEVNTAVMMSKIGLLVTGISILVTSAVAWAFNRIG